MNLVQNLRVGQRLGGAFTLLLMLLGLITAVAWMQTRQLDDRVGEFNDNTLPSVQLVHEVQSGLDEVRGLLALHIMTDSPKEMAALEATMKTGQQKIGQQLAAYDKLISDDTDRRNHEAVKAGVARYWVEHDKLLAVSRRTASDPAAAEQARALLTGDSQRAYKQLDEALDAWWAYNAQLAAQAAKQAHAGASSAAWWLGGLALTAAVLGVAAALWITRSITVPLAQAATLAAAVGNGDLTRRAGATGRDEIGQLLHSLDGMTLNLARMVGDVRAGTDGIATASAQIAQGNADLSARTEQQASSLQQTAASMEQMSGTVRASADNAQAADQLARSASDAARRGGEAVGQVVATMQEIQAASRKIADIIGTIDGIAFQTNILALNAAVEAARAGEQGRGFSVVAAEVRSLAQRSAEAAREIKVLINGTVERIDAGTLEVNAAGGTIGDVVGQVRQVSDLIGEITAASTEQNAGVGQINTAIGQLDQATQQNAALVEETAAAADSLSQQATRLAATVAGFRVAGHTPNDTLGPTPGHTATRPTASPAPVAARAPRPPAPAPVAVPAVAAAKAPAPVAATAASASGGEQDWAQF